MKKYHLKLKHGALKTTIEVSFDPARNAAAFERLLSAAILAERQMKRSGETSDGEAYAEKVLDLYALVLGEATTRSLCAWAGNDLPELFSQINPFIVGTIAPTVREASAGEREKLRRQLVRSQRRRAKP